jgi:hypothetical protein
MYAGITTRELDQLAAETCEEAPRRRARPMSAAPRAPC